MHDNDKNALIGKIYETSLSPGDWVDLLDSITGWVQPQIGDGEPSQHSAEVEQLIEHLERAVRNSAYISSLEDRGQLFDHMYSQMPWPMLMLSDAMQVIDCNPAARQMLSSPPIQLMTNGSLSFSDSELKRDLKQVISMANGRQTQILNSSEQPLTLLCIPVEKSDAPGDISLIRTIVWVLAGQTLVTPSPEILQSVFKITQAEARLLHLLCKVGNLNQSADLLAISVHTARTQLKSIMSKLGTSSQVQLVSQAMSHSLLQTAQTPACQQQRDEHTMTLPDGRVLSWYEYGAPQGRPVLTLDNLGGALPDHSLFEDWYLQHGLRVILIVRPGYGLSTTKPDMEFRDFGPDIRALCAHLQLDRPAMASYCGGGPYALCAAALYPNLFDRLGLLASTVPIEHFELDKLDRVHTMFLRIFQKDPRLFVLVGSLALRGVRRAPEKFFARLAKSLCEEDQAILNNPDLMGRLLHQMRLRHFQGARIIIEEYMRLQHPWDVDLSQITIPTMVWHGEDDRVISVGGARAMAGDIPGATFKSLPGKGRFMVYPVWKEFLTELLELPPPEKVVRKTTDLT